MRYSMRAYFDSEAVVWCGQSFSVHADPGNVWCRVAIRSTCQVDVVTLIDVHRLCHYALHNCWGTCIPTYADT